jgi:hypothetical protein
MGEKSLSQQVKSFWTNQHTSGHTGLVLLNKCIENVAVNRDWDALARFVAGAGVDRPKIGLIIRVAFGDKLRYAKDAKHPAGGKFKMGWEGQFDLAASNTYGLIQQALENGKSFRSEDFLKACREVVGTPEKKPNPLLKEVESVLKYLQKKVQDIPALEPTLRQQIKDMAALVDAQKAKMDAAMAGF